jgi:RNA polymerase sigma factor (sigma-70 family)
LGYGAYLRKASVVAIDNEVDLSPAQTIADLYEREHGSMVRLAALIVGSQALAEEVVHDAFVSVLERRATITEPGAYLRRVVVNNCHGVTRRSLVGRRKIARLAVLEGDPFDVLPELDETWSALEQVTPKQRTALVLRFYADLPIAEIAEAMDERPGTVKSLVHRGLATLRKELST